MCLSSVYQFKNNQKELLLKDVQHVSFDAQQRCLIFTDLFGLKKQYEGRISLVDLIKNEIIVDCEESS